MISKSNMVEMLMLMMDNAVDDKNSQTKSITGKEEETSLTTSTTSQKKKCKKCDDGDFHDQGKNTHPKPPMMRADGAHCDEYSSGKQQDVASSHCDTQDFEDIREDYYVPIKEIQFIVTTPTKEDDATFPEQQYKLLLDTLRCRSRDEICQGFSQSQAIQEKQQQQEHCKNHNVGNESPQSTNKRNSLLTRLRSSFDGRQQGLSTNSIPNSDQSYQEHTKQDLNEMNRCFRQQPTTNTKDMKFGRQGSIIMMQHSTVHVATTNLNDTIANSKQRDQQQDINEMNRRFRWNKI